jgi:hypothetical protein
MMGARSNGLALMSALHRFSKGRSWLQAAVRAMSPSRLVYPGQQTFEQESPLSHRFRLLHLQEQTFLVVPPFVWL